MRLQTIERNIETNGVLSEGDFGISSGDQAHILTILRDKLYSDKFAAIVREYSTNAWDAHIEAGIPDRPIKVTIPTRWEPTLSIRDYGFGLTREQVYNVYAKYGRSTKRNSNDVIGQLGLGCKSGFAYSNTFTIISYCQGSKTTYVAYIDESNVGKISELESVASNETGVEIQIPIRATDVEVIKERGLRLFPYFNPVPECNVTIPKPEYSVTGNFWAIRTVFAPGPMAIMGNVPYPIDIQRLPELNVSGKEILECGIDIKFNIGELSISASREALEYTDAGRQAIYKKLAIIRNEVLAALKAEFDACQNIWEARMFYQRTQNTGVNTNYRYGYNQRNIVASLAATTFKTWHGKSIESPSINFDKYTGDSLEVRGMASGAQRATDAGTPDWRKTAQATKDLVVIKNDVKSSWLKRTLHWRTTEAGTSTSALVIDFKGEVDDPNFDIEINKYLEAQGLTGIPIHNVSTFPIPENTIIAPNGTLTRVPDAKAKAKVFQIIQTYDSAAYPASKNWTPAEVDLEEDAGVYTVIHGYQPLDDTKVLLLKLLFALGYDTSTAPIYGIRASEKDKLGPNWIELGTWGTAKAKELLAISPLREPLINYYINTNYSLGRNTTMNNGYEQLIELSSDKRVSQAIKTIRDAHTAMSSTDWKLRNRYQTILGELQNDIMADISTSIKAIEDVEKEYPLLKDLDLFHGGGYFRTDTWPATLAKYIELIMKN